MALTPDTVRVLLEHAERFGVEIVLGKSLPPNTAMQDPNAFRLIVSQDIYDRIKGTDLSKKPPDRKIDL